MSRPKRLSVQLRELRPARGGAPPPRALALLVLAFLVWSCGDDATGPDARASVVVVPDSAAITERGALQLAAVHTEFGDTVMDRPITWESSNRTVAGVDSTGLVKAFVPGRATITARADGVSGEAEITVTPLVPVASVSAGYFHDCLVAQSGRAYCWGTSLAGQLGNDSIWFTPTPVRVTGGLSFASVGTGHGVTCGLTVESDAYCWGARGMLGSDAEEDSPVPKLVAGGRKYVSLSVGYYHSCALTADGTAYCWGWSIDGQLGTGSTDSSFVLAPVRVAGSLSFESISAGWRQTCGVTVDERAYCWGRNYSGQVGIDSAGSILSPVAVQGGIGFAAISAGEWHTCGLTTGGQTYCWGRNSEGQLGSRSTERAFTPLQAAVGYRFRQLSSGYMHSCGVTGDGAGYCWGSNPYGALGQGTFFEISARPVRVSRRLSFESVSVGFHHSCGVTSLGAVYCWGQVPGLPHRSWRPVRIFVPQ